MAQYPENIFEPRERENKPGRNYEPNRKHNLYAEDINLGDDEIVAIEETLGENPQGESETVGDRITEIEGKFGKTTIVEIVDREDNLHRLEFVDGWLVEYITNVYLATQDNKYITTQLDEKIRIGV